MTKRPKQPQVYFTSEFQYVDIQVLENGEWVTLIEDVKGAGYITYLQEQADNPNFRAIDGDGNEIVNPMNRIGE